MVDGDDVKIVHLVRQAVELGVDIIKADPTDEVDVYHRVIEAGGGIPVLLPVGCCLWKNAGKSAIGSDTENFLPEKRSASIRFCGRVL